jgi:hypothetical protein
MHGAGQVVMLFAKPGATGPASVPFDAFHFRTTKSELVPLDWINATSVPFTEMMGEVVTV